MLETSTCNYDYFLFVLTLTGKSLEIRDYLKKICVYNTRLEKKTLRFLNGDHFKMEQRSLSISPLFWPRASLDALLWTFSSETMSFTRKGHHTGAAYSIQYRPYRDLYSKENSFTLLDPSTRLMTPKTLLALLTTS